MVFCCHINILRRVAGAILCVTGMIYILSGNPDPFNDRGYFEARLEGPLLPDDPAVLEELRSRYLTPPSIKSYNLHAPEKYLKYYSFVHQYSHVFYKSVLEQLFEKANKRNGFFIEAGAMDGEWASNTIELEINLNWAGLLVEPDKEMFAMLLEKNRKCWAANICLSPHPYAYKDTMRKLSSPTDVSEDMATKSENSFIKYEFDERSEAKYTTYEAVQCFPIESVLLALGVTNITVFSLDVEDVEWGILRHFPFTSVSVEVWLVEHNLLHPDGSRSATYDPDFVKWFEDRDYRLFAHMEFSVVDYVFVHRKSGYSSLSYKDTGLQEHYIRKERKSRVKE